MRKSRWLVADTYTLSKKSRRLVVDTGGKRSEIALATTDLLATAGRGRITSDAVELLCSEDTDLVLYDGTRHYWLDCGSRRAVEYLIGQRRALTRLAEAALTTYLRSAAQLLARMGSEARHLAAFYADNPSPEAAEKVEQILLVEIYERLRVDIDYPLYTEIYRLYKAFIEAETISALLRAGLNPAISYRGRPFYHIAALEHHPPLIWESLRGLRHPQRPSRASWLLQLKNRVDGLLEYRGRALEARRVISIRARGMASAAINDKVEVEPIEW